MPEWNDVMNEKSEISFGRLLNGAIWLNSIAILMFFLAILIFGAGSVPVEFDIAFLVAILTLCPVIVMLGVLTRSQVTGARRWRSSVLGLAEFAVGIVLGVIGVGRLT